MSVAGVLSVHACLCFIHGLCKQLTNDSTLLYTVSVKLQFQDGVHVIKNAKEEVTPEQLKLMRTQDIKYIEMKRVAEAKVAFTSLF